MRVSALTSFVLAAVVSSAAGKTTYLKSSDGDYLVGSLSTSDNGDAGVLAFYPKSHPEKALPIKISDGMLDYSVSNFYFDAHWADGDLTEEVWGYELVRDGPGDKGFSWGKNGVLEVSNSNFHGWVHCKGGKWTGADGLTTFRFSTKPIKNCQMDAPRLTLSNTSIDCLRKS